MTIVSSYIQTTQLGLVIVEGTAYETQLGDGDLMLRRGSTRYKGNDGDKFWPELFLDPTVALRKDNHFILFLNFRVITGVLTETCSSLSDSWTR